MLLSWCYNLCLCSWSQSFLFRVLPCTLASNTLFHTHRTFVDYLPFADATKSIFWCTQEETQLQWSTTGCYRRPQMPDSLSALRNKCEATHLYALSCTASMSRINSSPLCSVWPAVEDVSQWYKGRWTLATWRPVQVAVVVLVQPFQVLHLVNTFAFRISLSEEWHWYSCWTICCWWYWDSSGDVPCACCCCCWVVLSSFGWEFGLFVCFLFVEPCDFMREIQRLWKRGCSVLWRTKCWCCCMRCKGFQRTRDIAER